jgi:hypothetical protein
MTSVDINKWISGEIEAFCDPPTPPSPVVADSDPGEERSTTRPSLRRFSYPVIAAVVVALASVFVASIMIAMRYSGGPTLAADGKSQPSDSTIVFDAAKTAAPSAPASPTPTEIAPTLALPLSTQPATRPDPQRAALLSNVGTWYDQHTKAAPIPQRKPSPTQRASSRNWPRYPSRVQTDGGEATRLMVDELRQRGVAVGTAFEARERN